MDDKDTTLQKLQQPLRQLYFGQEERDADGSRLEISTQGLRLVASSGGVSVSHAFSAIAVWAAVKCVARDDGRSCAFLPLIADPDGQDKSGLFEPLHEQRHMDVARGAHSPLLAVIMRQRGATRQLFCHAFECACAEDAIVMAANLYQALMINMKGKHTQSKVSCAFYYYFNARRFYTTGPQSSVTRNFSDCLNVKFINMRSIEWHCFIVSTALI